MSDQRGKKPITDEDLITRGGAVGAIIAFTVTFLAVVVLAIANSQGPRSVRFFEILPGMACFSVIPTSLGYFAGKEGARSKTVPGAFIKGAVFFGCAMAVCGFVYFILLLNIVNETASVTARAVVLAPIVLSVLVVGTASLVSGLAAIFVRDYRQFNRLRLLPQFTLQELMIVTTLVAIILSAIASMAWLRG
jgi:hypothetical protein